MAKLRQPTLPLMNYQALASLVLAITLAGLYVNSNYHVEYKGANPTDECLNAVKGIFLKNIPINIMLLTILISVVELYLKKASWVNRNFLNAVLFAYGLWAILNFPYSWFYTIPECAVGNKFLEFTWGQQMSLGIFQWLFSWTMIVDGLPGTRETIYDCFAMISFPRIGENGRPDYVKSVKQYSLNIVFHWGIWMLLMSGCMVGMSIMEGLHPLIFDGVLGFFAFMTLSGPVFCFMTEMFFRLNGCVGCLFGIVPAHTSWNPILSTSIKEFWGKRYNIWIHHYLKNMAYKPVMSVLSPREKKSVPGGAEEKKPLMSKKAASVLACAATMWIGGFLHEIGSYNGLGSASKDAQDRFFKEATLQALPGLDGIFGWWFLFYGIHTVGYIVEDYFRGLQWNIPDFFKHQLFLVFILPTMFLPLYMGKFNFMNLWEPELSLREAPFLFTLTPKVC